MLYYINRYNNVVPDFIATIKTVCIGLSPHSACVFRAIKVHKHNDIHNMWNITRVVYGNCKHNNKHIIWSGT